MAAELQSGMSPRNIGLLVRQKAADWETSLAPVLAKHGVVLRNEDRDVGGASIQDLMTEPYATTVLDGFELLLRERGGAVWVRVLEAFSDMEGLVSDEEPERIQEIAEKLDAFHAANRINSPESLVVPAEAGNLLTAIETFFGVSALKVGAPQYQQGDFFNSVRAATKAFLQECATGNVSWQEWDETGAKSKVFVNGVPIGAQEFQRLLLEKLNIPLLHFPKGSPYSGQTWPELSFRMLLRHIFRQQRFWSDIADKQPDGEQHACLLQFLGLAESVFSDEYGELIRLKNEAARLQARREQYEATLQQLAGDVLAEMDLKGAITISRVTEAQERLDINAHELRQRRSEILEAIRNALRNVDKGL